MATSAESQASTDKEAAKWRHLVKMAEKDQERWEKRGDRILKLYRDDRDNDDNTAPRHKRMNILWSNVQTLKPALFSRVPIPIAERRFLDKDDIGRVASMILERAMRYEIASKSCNYEETVTKNVYDYLLPGRGVAWLRFNPIFGPATSLTDRGDDQLPDEGESSGVSPDDDQSGSGGAAASPQDDKALVDPQGVESENSTDEIGQPDEMLLDASVTVDYVNWKDFLHSKARTWDEVEWVARRVYMTRDDLIGRFGDEIGKKVPLDRDATDDKDNNDRKIMGVDKDELKKATVYEIWCKYDRKVYFVAKMYENLLQEPEEDPLNLEGFWPCPRPLFATMTNDTLTPVPDYAEYQDQAQEIDHLTQRIDVLLNALRVRGTYDASIKQLARLLDEGQDNVLIPIPNWAAFAEKGGLTGGISLLPLKDIADTLLQLFEARDKIKQDLYEVTGIADIIRGESDPRETAEAVATKGRFGTMRLQDRQREVARFCRDIVAMVGEIISEHFPDETLMTVSGIMYDEGVGPSMPEEPTVQPPQGPPPQAQPGQMLPPEQAQQLQQAQQQYAQQAQAYQQAQVQYQMAVQQAQQERQMLITQGIQLLRRDKLRGFRIDIETDSTVQEDANNEKQARVQFLQAASGFLKESIQAVQMAPDMAPLLAKMMMFGIRGFRAGRDLESAFEEYTDKAEKNIKKMASQPKPPSPEMIKAQSEEKKGQVELAKAQTEAQSEQNNAMIEAQSKKDDAILKATTQQQDAALKAQQQDREDARAALEHQMELEKMERDREYEQIQHWHRMQEMMQKKELAEAQAKQKKEAMNKPANHGYEAA